MGDTLEVLEVARDEGVVMGERCRCDQQIGIGEQLALLAESYVQVSGCLRDSLI